MRRITLVAGLMAVSACGGEPYGRPVRVVIPRGATFADAADSLARPGVVESAKLFRVYAWVTGRDRSLKAGTYLLQRGTSWGELVEALTAGRGIVRTITIPEGFALRNIEPLLAQTLNVPADSVAAAVRDSALRRELDIPIPTLEGYLFPETYSFPDGTTARQAVTAMVKQFQRAWRPEWDARLQELAMSRHDIMSLAAIIEKEARLAEERPVISAVYHNRLKAGMPLQADPTVQYARGEHARRVLYRHLEVESPYNTYRNRGLPPGPIASPGIASIEAALHPADVPYRFFVAHPDGHHEFHVTFEGHAQARQRVQRERRARSNGSRR